MARDIRAILRAARSSDRAASSAPARGRAGRPSRRLPRDRPSRSAARSVVVGPSTIRPGNARFLTHTIVRRLAAPRRVAAESRASPTVPPMIGSAELNHAHAEQNRQQSAKRKQNAHHSPHPEGKPRQREDRHTRSAGVQNGGARLRTARPRGPLRAASRVRKLTTP